MGGEKVIQSLTIVNPYNPGHILSLKETYLDVKAVLADGSLVAISMQIASMAAFNKRVAYNLAKAYTNQLVKGEDYPPVSLDKHEILYSHACQVTPLLNPAISVTITDFILFKNTEDVINQFVFQESKKKFKFLDEELQLIFVELPKFKKTLSDLKSLTDKWIYFLKEAAS